MNIKLFKKEKSFEKGGLHVDPNICWNYILSASFLIIVLSLAFGVYLFLKVNNEPRALVELSGKSVNKERIEKALIYFRQRAEKSNDILNSPSPIVDPSL